MPATNRKRTAALCSVFLAAGVVLGPIGFQQAASAAPAQAHAGTTTTAPASSGDYKQGFRDGFRSGYRDGRHCHHHPHHDDHHSGKGLSLKDPNRDYQQGFRNGYKSGFRLGRDSC
ncbi:hypothetical protein ACFWN1_03830 [Streptomyces sp. NPDC058459]|uniref:hypothetical protein n=1 Tax=Streptomyces sp. NPDC058459 TaxID=3346508 RepID=UPI0036699C8A